MSDSNLTIAMGGSQVQFSQALIADVDTNLGFTAIGIDAGEIMAGVQFAMAAGMPYTGAFGISYRNKRKSPTNRIETIHVDTLQPNARRASKPEPICGFAWALHEASTAGEADATLGADFDRFRRA